MGWSMESVIGLIDQKLGRDNVYGAFAIAHRHTRRRCAFLQTGLQEGGEPPARCVAGQAVYAASRRGGRRLHAENTRSSVAGSSAALALRMAVCLALSETCLANISAIFN